MHITIDQTEIMINFSKWLLNYSKQTSPYSGIFLISLLLHHKESNHPVIKYQAIINENKCMLLS